MARRAALIAATVAVLLAGLASGGTTPNSALLRRYAPILVLHPEEQLAPVAADGFLADSDLTVKGEDGTWAPVAIPLAGAPRAARLDQRLCRAIDGPDATPCYVAAQAEHDVTPTVYGAVFRTRTRIALQYWLFYPFNPYEFVAPELKPSEVSGGYWLKGLRPFNPYEQSTTAGRFWQAHEGDWEAVTVLLDAKERPLLVGLSRHCSGVKRTWARVPRKGAHPLVHVALGSHANYFGVATRPLDRRCWPPEALAVYDAYGVTLLDRTGSGRTVVPRVVQVRAGVPTWMRYRGAWGEAQYVGFPGVAPLAFGAGPVGPAFHALWRRPVATPLAWPPG